MDYLFLIFAGMARVSEMNVVHRFVSPPNIKKIFATFATSSFITFNYQFYKYVKSVERS